MARQRFTRHTQPIACPGCGKETTGVEGTKLCRQCFNESELENEHQDGYHDDSPHPDCPLCKEEASMRPNARVTSLSSSGYAIEIRDQYGWSLLKESTAATGFVRGPRLYATREAAEEQVREMVAVGWQPAKLRVVVATGARGTGRRYRANAMRGNSSEQYWVWALGRDRKPLTNEGPWGPYDYAAARQYARISATKGAHDRAVSHGKDPSSASFEIVRVYKAGTGEHKYGMAQRIGAPMAANGDLPWLELRQIIYEETPQDALSRQDFRELAFEEAELQGIWVTTKEIPISAARRIEQRIRDELGYDASVAAGSSSACGFLHVDLSRRHHANGAPDHELWLCDDCTIVEVNDDPSGIDSDERVEEVYEALHALKQHGHIAPDWDSETGEGIKEFSRSRCDSCGTSLAGSRHRFAQWTK